MKPSWHLSSLVVLAGALHAQTPTTSTEPTPPTSPAPTATAPAPAATAPETPAPGAPAAEPSMAPTTPVSVAPAAPAVADSVKAPKSPESATQPAAPAAATPAAPKPAQPAPAATAPAAKPATPAASAPAARPASTPAAAKPAPAATPAGKPAAAAATEAPKSDKPAEAKGKEGGEGFKFQPGMAFGTVTMGDKTWTRLTFTPEISVGKLGVGMNIEVFMDDQQNLSTRGWDFDTKRNGVESILRKIDYVRWDKPGAPFYARLGTLEGIQLGYGLVSADFGNKARYPDYKELGLNLQLNDISALGLDFETVVNNLQDIQTGGPVTAFKAGIRPFKPMGIPLFKDLAVHAGVAYDWNQYAGLRDVDGDGCPDAIDKAPNDKSTCVSKTQQEDVPGYDKFAISYVNQNRRDSFDLARSDSLRRDFSMRKPFSVYWADASLPIINTSFFGLEVHSAFAKPETQDPAAMSAGWGAIPLGAGSHIGPITLTAEYRAFSLPFQPNYFDAYYEIDRAKYIDGQVRTKEVEIYHKGAQTGMVQGYYAGAGWDVFGFLTMKADYSDLFPSKSTDDELRSAKASIGVGPAVTSLLQGKISLAEIYWQKDRIGLDKWTTSDSVNGALVTTNHHDSFLGNNIYTAFGYRIGSTVAGGLTLIVDRQTTFSRDADGKLVRSNQMRIESQMKF